MLPPSGGSSSLLVRNYSTALVPNGHTILALAVCVARFLSQHVGSNFALNARSFSSFPHAATCFGLPKCFAICFTDLVPERQGQFLVTCGDTPKPLINKGFLETNQGFIGVFLGSSGGPRNRRIISYKLY